MLKIAVISDSHWGKVHLEMFAKLTKENAYDAVIHLGDGLSDAKWLAKALTIPVKYIAGNCDPQWSCARELRETFEQVRVLGVHGDLYGVKYDYSQLSYYGEEAMANVVLFGHTHQAYAGYVGRVLMLNPGSLKEGHYAELWIDGEKVVPYLKTF